jgi:FAD/FMN-containing dehydrogenase
LSRKKNVIVYEQDDSMFHVMPEVVVLPADGEQVAAVVKAARPGVTIMPWGSGSRRLRCTTHNIFPLTGVSFAL